MTKLRQCGEKWSFHNESELEDFVWLRLETLFGFSRLKRQYSIKGQFCDILAVTEHQQLVVIELKNEVDRYVVQQLTRYYDALRQEQPFSNQIDYSKPIRLIAIAPSFHPDSWIDRQYNRLSLEFLQFEILSEQDGLTWKLQDLERQQTRCLGLPNPTAKTSWDLPPVPRKLLNSLANIEETHRTQILNIRQTLLEFDERMRETVQSSQLLYGKGKTQWCAELRLISPLYEPSKPKKPNLFLRLPHPQRRQMCRMLILTRDWNTVDSLSYCPRESRGFGGYDYWQRPASLLKAFQEWDEETQAFGIKYYSKLLENPDQAASVNLWVEIALEHWAKKY